VVVKEFSVKRLLQKQTNLKEVTTMHPPTITSTTGVLTPSVIDGIVPLRQRARIGSECVQTLEEITSSLPASSPSGFVNVVTNSVCDIAEVGMDKEHSGKQTATRRTKRKRKPTMELIPVFDVLDKRLLLLLCVLGFCTRFYSLGWPKSVMFDEAHFVKFVSCYFTHEYFFDIHPPLAKLLMALVGNLGIWKGNQPIERYSGDYRDDFYFYLRLVPAFCGSLLVPMIYACGRASKLSKFPSFIGNTSTPALFLSSSSSLRLRLRLRLTLHLTVVGLLTAAWFVLLDNLILLEARTAVTDSVLLFWVASCYLSGAMMTRKKVFSHEW
jgi:hypothetical protein